MAPIAKQISEMVDILPKGEQDLAFEFVKRLVLAWDPDYTKLTPKEANDMLEGESQIANGETVSLASVL